MRSNLEGEDRRPLLEKMRDEGWLERHPLLAAAAASAAFLALAQATFLLLRNRDFLGPEMAAGMTKLSVLLGVVTGWAGAWATITLVRTRPGDRRATPAC